MDSLPGKYTITTDGRLTARPVNHSMEYLRGMERTETERTTAGLPEHEQQPVGCHSHGGRRRNKCSQCSTSERRQWRRTHFASSIPTAAFRDIIPERRTSNMQSLERPRNGESSAVVLPRTRGGLRNRGPLAQWNTQCFNDRTLPR